MASLGEELREAREAKDMSLAEVHGASSIPVHYLEAMENGASRLVADEYYVVPYLRRYATFLGLDPAASVARYLGEVLRREKRASPTRETVPNLPAGWVVGGAVAAVAAVVLVWFVLL